MRAKALTVLLVVLAMPASAAAETKTFTGPGSGNPGDWTNPGHWSPPGVPGPGDDVIAAAGGVLDGAAATVRSLVVNSNVQLVVRHNGGVLTVTGGAGAPPSSIAGTLFAGFGGTFTLQAGAELTQSGQLAFGSSSPSGAGGTVNNAGSWTLTTGVTGVNFGEGPVAFNNSGTLVGDGTGDLRLAAPLVNTGTVSAEEGALVAAGGVSGAGDYTIDSGATLTLLGTVPAGGSVAGAGTARLRGLSVEPGATFSPATLQMVDGTNDLDVDVDVTTLLGDGGIRTGSGTLDVGTGPSRLAGMSFQGTSGTGPTNFPAGVALPVTGGLSVLNDAVVNLNGITTWSGGTLATGQNGGPPFTGSTINNGGIFRIEGDGLNTFTAAGGVFHNLPGAEIVRDVGTGSSEFGAGIVDNDGSLTVATGTLNVFVTVNSSGPITVADGATMDGFATTTLESGGSLTGAGTVAMNVVNQAGTVRPGSSPGVLAVDGNYTQGATGTLEAEIAGTAPGAEFDQLAVTGAVALDGTLAIVNDPGFDPAPGDTFDVVTSGGDLSGSFATVTGAQVNGGSYSPSYTPGPPGRATLALQLPAAPSNTSPPSLPASAQVGDTVTCDPGTWTGSPTFAFQWLRDGLAIAGATADTYTLVDADAGRSVVCRVTATNAGGDTDADSGSLVPTAPPPPPSPPVNTTAPSLPSGAEVGQTVTCDPGTWTGAPTFAYSWLRGGVEVAGATAQAYRLTAADTGATIVCRVNATNGAGSVSADSGPLVPTARTETIRGDQAFAEGTANDLYLACTRLDLWLIDVLPRGRRRILVSGAADLRLVGQTVGIFLGQRAPGRRVGRARVQPDGSFKTTIPAPRGARARKAARYQARAGSTRSQRLRLVRRMVATTLVRRGDGLELSGVLLRPFTSPPAAIEIERYLSCRRRERMDVVAVRPNRRGRFTVRIPLPGGTPAVLYRARTRAPTTTTGRIANVFTLPRALDLF